MDKVLALENARREVEDFHIRVEAIKNHIKRLEQDIALLKSLESQFSQNLSILKEEKVIAVASEYKKVRTDLDTVKNRLYVLQIDHGNNVVVLDRAVKMLFESRERYDSLLRNQDAQVIVGKFGNDRQKRNAEEDP